MSWPSDVNAGASEPACAAAANAARTATMPFFICIVPLRRAADRLRANLSPPVAAHFQLLPGVFKTPLQVDTLLFLQSLLHTGRCHAASGDIFNHHRPHEGTPAFGQRHKARKLPARRLREGFPEIG